MIFLGMGAGLIGALLGTTVLAVIYLYWLKPPPQRVVVPSTLLWNRLLKEKKRNTFTAEMGNLVRVVYKNKDW